MRGIWPERGIVAVAMLALLVLLLPPLAGRGARASGQAPPRVALTFDDGYNLDHRIIEFLSSQGIRATAFVIGSWAQRNPSILVELNALGWDICNHTQNHPWLTRLPDAQVRAELDTCRSVITSLSGQDLPAFRPPGGFIDTRVMALAEAAGYKPVMWSIDSGDARGVDFSVSERVAYMVNAARDGSVVLFHFGGRHTFELVTGLVEGLRARGFCFVTVSELYGWKSLVRGGDAGPGMVRASSSVCFPEGTTRPGFEEWLLIFNPGRETARVHATFFSPQERVERDYEVPPRSRRSVRVNDEVPFQDDVAVMLVSSRPVAAERMLYGDKGRGVSGGALSTGLSRASSLRYFPEGTTREGFEEYLALLNPSPSEVELELEMEGNGKSIKHRFTLPAQRRTTVCLNDLAEADDWALTLRSTEPLFAERSGYFTYQGRVSGTACSAGADSPRREWFFAEGTTRDSFHSYLVLFNPCRFDTWARVSLWTGRGPVAEEDVLVRSGERKTLLLDPLLPAGEDYGIHVRSLLPLVAERSAYFQAFNAAGGYCDVGVPKPERRWLFAEGCTAGDYREWLALCNPFPWRQVVRITILADGREEKRYVGLPPLSRETVDVGGMAGRATEVLLEVDAPLGVIAERSLYFTR